MSQKNKIYLSSLLVLLGVYGLLQIGAPLSERKIERKPNRLTELGPVTVAKEKPPSEISVIFNDPAIHSKWDLKKMGAEEAWKISQGSRDIVVAVIDTGCDIEHEDLRSNIWVNRGETGLDAKGKDKRSNGIDDDGNGYIDDVHGWNFVANNNKLDDNHGHGTHIAGIIGAEGGNNKGIVGVAPKVSLMTLKYFEPKTPTDNLRNTIAAIRYATKMKVHIINYSGGGLEFSREEKSAIQEAEKEGILFIAAAGNERSNSDKHKYFPADYGLSNIISVTAIDPQLKVLPSSNFGLETVHLAAPGQNILSTLPKNAYGLMTGTSQATAIVAGAAAVVMAHKGNFSFEDTKKYLLSTGDSEESLINKTKTSRRLNLYKALTMLDSGLGLTGVQAANINANAPVFSPESSLFQATPGNAATTEDKTTIGANNPRAAAQERTPSGSSTVGGSPTPSSLSGFGQSLLNAVQKQASDDKKAHK